MTADAAVRARIEVVPVDGPRDLDRFIQLPRILYKNDPNYVPQLTIERRGAFTAKGNPYFQHADVALWIARRSGIDVGRISAQQDRLLPDTDIGHFGLLAAIDDRDVVSALLETAEQWLRQRGVSRVQGPFSLSINEEIGVLIDGFDTPPMLMMPHDPPYLDGLLHGLGYGKIKDVYAYISGASGDLPANARAMIARGLPSRVTLRKLRRENLQSDVEALVDIYNDAWSDHWGFVPITREEVARFAKEMKPLLDERLVWFAEVDGEPAAFGLALPNLNEAIRDLNGKLFPFGWAKLLWRLKVSKIKTARIPLMGVRQKFTQTLLGRLLALHISEALRREASALGIQSMEMSWVLEDNMPMRHLAEAVGGVAYKTYRIYEKVIG